AQAAPLPLARLGDDRDGVPLHELVLVLDVVVMRVRPQEGNRSHAPGLRRLDERGDAGAGVDEHCRSTFHGEQIRVAQPAGMHAPLDKHGARLTARYRRGGLMAGLWSRTTTVVKAKYSKLLNKAQNPTETLDYSYEQMLDQLQNVKRGVADVFTSKKRIELQQQKLEQNVVKLDTQARQ